MKSIDELYKLRKAEIAEEITKITDNYNDEELKYAIEIMLFWKNERERQNKEIEEKEVSTNE